MESGTVNILILREVRAGERARFEDAVREWIPRAVRFPGHLGVFMLTPPHGSDEYGALLRFESLEAWEQFSAWEEYGAFLAAIRPMLASEPRTETLHGMEAWFRHSAVAPPRWKMALLTYLGVCAMVWLSATIVHRAFGAPAGWASYLLINAMVVCGLTWLVMPQLTRLARPWLRGKRRSS